MRAVLEIIKDRRSVRKFNDEPLLESEIETIVEAGRWAPTGGGCQTVHFTVVTNAEVLEALRRTVEKAFANMEYSEDLYVSIQHSIKNSLRGGYNYDYNAPALIIVSNRADYPNAIADSACALQNMMLVATELGVGSCWINQLHWLDENELVRGVLEGLGITSDETITGALAIGHYDNEIARIPRKGMIVDYIK